EAAEAITSPESSVQSEKSAGLDPTLDSLDSLLNKSLLRREDHRSGEPRLRMLESVRELALEHLASNGDAEAAARRHAAYFLTLAEKAASKLAGAEQAEWLARLAAEHDNIRAALAWALAEGEGELALRLARAMGRFWFLHGHLSEGRRWL